MSCDVNFHVCPSAIPTVVNFTVVARETVSEKAKSSSALVTVHIRDTNDNFPVFSEDQYEVRLRCWCVV